METGNYNDYRKWSKYIVTKFPMYLFDRDLYETVGCGANALAMLTGDNPWLIRENNLYNDNYSDEFMLKYLRCNKIKCIKLTKCNLTNRKNDNVIACNITDKHVVLMSQLIKKAEATWVVNFAGLSWHNYSASTVSYLDMISHPVVSAYVLFSPDWK